MSVNPECSRPRGAVTREGASARLGPVLQAHLFAAPGAAEVTGREGPARVHEAHLVLVPSEAGAEDVDPEVAAGSPDEFAGPRRPVSSRRIRPRRRRRAHRIGCDC